MERLLTAASWIWGSIVKCMDLLNIACYFQVGADTNTRILLDPWIPSLRGFQLPPQTPLPQ